MLKKIAAICGVLTVGLLLSACTGSGDEDGSAGTGFIGGTNGVQLQFSNNAPPGVVADNGQQSFPVIVQAQNQGEQSVAASNATITLEGFSYEAFNKSQADLVKPPAENIPANRQTPDGDTIDAAPVFTEFPDFNYVNNVQAGYETAMIARMCYEYGSTTSSVLCIRDDMLTADSDTPCAVSGSRQTSSSGAPVRITGVEQEEVSTSDRTLLSFTVQNQGSGQAFETGTTCNPGQGERTAGNVVVQFSGLSGVTEFDCRGHEELGPRRYRLRMSQNDLQQGDSFTCYLTIPEENRNNREEPFNVELSYLYETSTSKTLTVRNSPE
jgi:hypothetical protein